MMGAGTAQADRQLPFDAKVNAKRRSDPAVLVGVTTQKEPVRGPASGFGHRPGSMGVRFPAGSFSSCYLTDASKRPVQQRRVA